MKTQELSSTTSRRGFVRCLLAAGSVLALVKGSPVSAEPKTDKGETTNPKPSSRGYEETEHVRTYYRVARF